MRKRSTRRTLKLSSKTHLLHIDTCLLSRHHAPRTRPRKMPPRDDEYPSDMGSDSDDAAPQAGPSRLGVPGRGGRATAGPSAGTRAGKAALSKGKGKDAGYAWEATFKRSWDAVREDGEGGIEATVRDMLEAGKRRR